MNLSGCAVVGFADAAEPQHLLGTMPLETVYTRQERLRSNAGRTLQHWAGRLAAKYAVLRVLDVEFTASALGQVEVLPQPSAMCAHTAACLDGHPPAVRISPSLAALTPGNQAIRVSVTHAAEMALAVAIVSGRLLDDITAEDDHDR